MPTPIDLPFYDDDGRKKKIVSNNCILSTPIVAVEIPAYCVEQLDLNSLQSDCLLSDSCSYGIIVIGGWRHLWPSGE